MSTETIVINDQPATTQTVTLQPGVAEKIQGLTFVDAQTPQKISALTLQTLENMDAAQLIQFFTLNPADAFNVAARFKKQDAPQALHVEVETTASQATTTQPVNPFASLLGGGASASGLSTGVMSARVNPQAIQKAADAVLACTIWGGGIGNIFNKDFWSQVNLGTEWELREKIDAWIEDMETGRYISATSVTSLFESVKGMFGPRFDNLIQSVAIISQSHSTQILTGAIATMNLGQNVLGNLQMTVPYVAEELSTAVIASRTPEQAGRLIKSVRVFFEIIRDPRLHARTGIVDAANVDDAALQFIRQRASQEAARSVQLALAYEAFVRALAICNEANVANPDYLKTVGILASRLSVLYTMANGEEVTTVNTAAPFREGAEPHAAASATATATARVKFSLNLGKFNVSYERK